MQMTYFLRIVIWSFSIKVELLVGPCWSLAVADFSTKNVFSLICEGLTVVIQHVPASKPT